MFKSLPNKPFAKHSPAKEVEATAQQTPSDNRQHAIAKALVGIALDIDLTDEQGNRVRNADAEGDIHLESYAFPCEACQQTILSFQKRYPKIRLHLGYVDPNAEC